MSTNCYKNAESFIFNLKQSIDDIVQIFGDDSTLDFLLYADKEYGVMQRAELKEVMASINDLKNCVDGLSKSCLEIPLEFRQPDNQAGKKTLMSKAC